MKPARRTARGLQAAGAVLALVALGAAPAPAATHDTELGLLAGVIAGVHLGADNPSPVTGVVPGALLEATQRYDRFRLHLEGIPEISVRASGSGPLGTSSAKLSLLNSLLTAEVGRARRVRIGFGFQLINLQNFNANNGDVNQSRVTTPIYAVQSSLPLPRERWLELSLLLDPNLRGDLHVFHSNGQAALDKPEQGAEVDYSAGLGWRRHDVSYVLGVRGLSYHTRNLLNGELVDRNVGGGATFEVRFHLGRK